MYSVFGLEVVQAYVCHASWQLGQVVGRGCRTECHMYTPRMWCREQWSLFLPFRWGVANGVIIAAIAGLQLWLDSRPESGHLMLLLLLLM
jgi:hypothetical protein